MPGRICGKFSSNWEGPFRITDTAAGGAYRLECTENVECHASQILLELINKISVLFPRSVVLSLRRVFDREGFDKAL